VSTDTPFSLGTFAAADGVAFAGLVAGDGVAVLEDLLGPAVTIRSLLEDWDRSLPRLQQIANRPGARGAELQLDSLRPLPPVQPPGQIFQAGANYRTHVLELLAAAERRGDASDGISGDGRDVARLALEQRAAGGEPFVFQGSTHALVGANDDVILPPEYEQHDWELELAVVIGRRARRVPRELALGVVAGYTICNDVTTRDALARPDVPGGIDWLAAKNSPTFLPCGPLLVPAVHAGDPMNLRIELRLNGRVMQDDSTADMMFDVARLIEYVSTIAELHPGDMLLTGSPAGNGAHHGVFLGEGDVMEGTVTGLGAQRNRCVAERTALPHPAADAAA
jgi:2-keto-4-pentenoate hydratase/2-oxohepta-3-ene-1,7-dioic acid hydratase in catechol pathway